MPLASIISLVVIALLPVAWALASYFTRIPEQQRQALVQYAPMAAQIMRRNASEDAGMQLALAFMAKSFKASHLPLLPEEIVMEAIDTAALLLPGPK